MPLIRVEWGRTIAAETFKLSDLEPVSGEASVSVDQVYNTDLCKKVPRSLPGERKERKENNADVCCFKRADTTIQHLPC